MTALANPLCTRLVPPISWIVKSGVSVRVFFNGELTYENDRSIDMDETDAETAASMNKLQVQEGRFIEITVSRSRIESAMTSLRSFGFVNEDIYRMLDKGPWVLAFNINKVLPRIVNDLKVFLSYPSSHYYLIFCYLLFILTMIILFNP